MVRLSQTPAVLYVPYLSGSIGSMFPASRQDIEVLKARFVVFCQLMSGRGRKRWSNEVTCKEWVLVKDYRIQYCH